MYKPLFGDYVLCVSLETLFTCEFCVKTLLETIYCCWHYKLFVGYYILLLEIISISICQMQGFKRKQKKQRLYSLFAVCWQSTKVFAICPWLAKGTRGAQLCNLATTG